MLPQMLAQMLNDLKVIRQYLLRLVMTVKKVQQNI